MYSVSDTYKELSEAPIREYHLIFVCYHLVNGAYEKYAEYTTDDQPIISAKIVNGQTTGGFTLGSTICASLTMTVAKSMPIKTNDRINVFVLFETPYAHTASSETLSLGEFYVDSVQVSDISTQIIALDKMARLAKDYNSTLTYPSTISKMFVELAMQANAPVSANINVFNDAKVPEKPVKGQDSGGNDVYFTRREVLGYIVGINGGNAYIDKNGEINISIPKETGVTIDYTNVISQTLNDTSLEIKDININTGGTSQSTKDDLDDSTVELYYPISFDTSMLDTLKELVKALIGLKYDSVVLKKQGTGIFEPGDLVSYKAADGKVYKMLIMGIIYDFSGGFFSETLYSLAKSEAQKQYAGVENISQNIASSGSGGVASGTTNITESVGTLTEYEYLTDTSVKYNGKTYTVTIDQETGLISKIVDDQEGEFKPKLNGGITDTALHNAVFWAVAMLSILKKPDPEPEPEPVDSCFEILQEYNQDLDLMGRSAYNCIVTFGKDELDRGDLYRTSSLNSLGLWWDSYSLTRGFLAVSFVIGTNAADWYEIILPANRPTKKSSRPTLSWYYADWPKYHIYFSGDIKTIHSSLAPYVKIGQPFYFSLNGVNKFRDVFSLSRAPFISEVEYAWLIRIRQTAMSTNYNIRFVYFGLIPTINIEQKEIIYSPDSAKSVVRRYWNLEKYIDTDLVDIVQLESPITVDTKESGSHVEEFIEGLDNNVFFNTFDICDENGNVLLAKNCDIDFFFKL